MKIIATSDWHIGNLFHGNDRLPEHRHFLDWLLSQVKEKQPDALLVAGDVFDNGNPSAAAQSAYYEFLADATQVCPDMQVVVTAGNHDSASRLEAPRPLLSRHKVEIRGKVNRNWVQDDGGSWQTDFDDLMIPVTSKENDKIVVLAVPYLRNDIVEGDSYSAGVNKFLRTLTGKAREKYPDTLLVMMAHMYAKGAEIANDNHSEKIVIGGQEEVNMEGWTDHPDYLTCGHIHKRQHIWNTKWARYTGSVLPMSFAEKNYTHGVDFITIDKDKIDVQKLDYEIQHKLVELAYEDKKQTVTRWTKVIDENLPARVGEKLDENFVYVILKVRVDQMKNDDLKTLERLVNTKNAVLCKMQKVLPDIDIQTIDGNEYITSVDDILDRDPMMTLKETFMIKNGTDMSEHQHQMLKEIIDGIRYEEED